MFGPILQNKNSRDFPLKGGTYLGAASPTGSPKNRATLLSGAGHADTEAGFGGLTFTLLRAAKIEGLPRASNFQGGNYY